MMTSSTNRTVQRRATAALIFAVSLVAGCNEGAVPAPTGQLNSGGAPQQFSNDVPRMAPGPSVTSHSSGTGPGSSHAATTDQSAINGSTALSANAVNEEFYRIANEAGSGQLTGSPVDAETRDVEAIDKASASYPELATFDLEKAEVRPTPDASASFSSIVDPAEKEVPNGKTLVELSVAPADIQSVQFSTASAGQAIVASRQEQSGRPPFTRLERYDLATGQRVSAADLPDRATLLDVSADGSRALVRLTFGLATESRPTDSQTRLDVWELTEEEGRHIVGWQPGGSKEAPPAVPIDAAFVDGDRVVSLNDDGRLVLWNLVDQAAVYIVETGSRGPLLITPGRQYAVVFTGTTFGAFKADDGTFAGLLSPPRPTLAACTDAVFSHDGSQLAAVLRRPAQSLMTWDAATGQPSAEIEAAIGLDRGVHFGSPGYVVAGGVLFDVNRKKPVWLYLENTESKNVGTSLDQRHWVVSRPAFGETTLQPVDAPIDAVASATLTASNLTAPRLGPGDELSVGLEVTGLEGDRAEFEESLARSLGQVVGSRGLHLAADAELRLFISASDRRTGESIAFNAIGPGSNETVPAHEVDFTISLVSESDKVLWSETSRVPPSYFLGKQEGKTLEEVLVEALWKSVPGAIAAELEQSMPTYVRSTPPEATLGQTRLWVAVDDVSPPGSSQLVADGGSTGSDIESVTALQPSTVLSMGSKGVQDLGVAASGWMVTTHDDGGFRTWQPVPQTKTVQMAKEIATRNFATRIAIQPEGTVAYYGTRDGQIRTHDLVSRRTTVAHDSADGAVTALTVTSDEMVVAGTESGTVARWSPGDRSTSSQIATGDSPVCGLGAIPNTNQVVAAWSDGTAKLIDAGTGQVLQTYAVDGGSIHAVAVASNGTVAFATESRGIVALSPLSGDEVGQFGDGSATSVAFGSDPSQIAAGGAFGQILIWRMGTDAIEHRLEGAGGRVSTIVFSPDGAAVAAAVAGRPVIPVWNLSEAGDEGPSAAHRSPSSAHGSPSNARGTTFSPRRGGMFRGPSGAHN